MIEKEYKIRKSNAHRETVEVTLPTEWARYHKLKAGDTLKMFADGVVVYIPIDVSKEKEEKVRRFLEHRF